MLNVLTNNKFANTPDYNSIYRNAFFRIGEQLDDKKIDRLKLKQVVFYGIKYLNSMEEPKELDLEVVVTKLRFIRLVELFLSQLTPAELISIFPVSKTFDGDKYGCKDYFYTMQKINQMGINEVIGDKLHDLLWDYQNTDIELFMVAILSNASDLCRLNGQKGIVEQWCDDNGIATYSMHKDANGREYIQNNTTGRTAKVRRKIPKYLRVVK